MKKLNKTSLLFNTLIMSIILLFLSSCKKDPIVPKASFTYKAAGRDVTFTSTSSDATTFTWDFGDGTNSTEQNPKHTYDKYGAYTVKLTVVGAGGTATSLPDIITLAKTSDVKVDGTFTEWANIAEVVVPDKFGSITKVKVDYDALNIYFYVEGKGGATGPGVTGGLNGFFDVYLNTDNNPATGYFSGWYPKGYGADYLIEGDFHVMKDAELFKHQTTAAVTEFKFDKVGSIGGNIFKSSVVTVAGTNKAIEFSVTRASLTNLSTKLTYAIIDVDGNYYYPNNSKSRSYAETWGTIGSFPKDNTAEGKMVELDLTK
jgi:PKD repeat protein